METDVRHIVQRLIDNARRYYPDDRYPEDRDLAALQALRDVSVTIESMIDQHITSARRRERFRADDLTIAPGRSVSWAEIGNALGITGQAASKRARAHHLHVTPLTAEMFEDLVEHGRRLVQGRSS